MRQMVGVVVAIGVGLAAMAGGPTLGATQEQFREALATAIRAADYNCGRVTETFTPKATERGNEIKLQCDGGKFLYKVIGTPSGRLIVEPR